jgi:hypothetical protein
MASQVLVDNTSQSLPIVVKKLGGIPTTLPVGNPYIFFEVSYVVATKAISYTSTIFNFNIRVSILVIVN